MVPIEHHSLLSDQRGLALVDPSGAICWWCAPRPDSPPIFGHLLDDNAGLFRISIAEGQGTQQYRDGTLSLETEFSDATLVDWMDPEHVQPGTLFRTLSGRGTFDVVFAPRLDLGRIQTRLHVRTDGSLVVNDGVVVLRTSAGVAFEVYSDGDHQSARAKVALDGTLTFEVSVDPLLERQSDAAAPLSSTIAQARFSAIEQTSRAWLSSLRFPPSAAAKQLERSALLLRGLVYRPTGAIVAAATTSLPEVIGGVRNWDYRFCWPRDGSMTAAVLARLGDTAIGLRLLDFLLRQSDDLEDFGILEPLYSVSGEHLAGEELRDDVKGYANSAPVRIGNGAAGQIQLDAFGPVVDLIATLHDAGAPLAQAHLDFVRQSLDAVCRSWDRPGHGVWELRAKERSHVFSRGMCWLALTRGIRVLQDLAPQTPVTTYLEVAETIRRQVNTRAFHSDTGAYTMAYDEPDLDAAVLRLIGHGLFDDVEKERQTVARITEQLDAWPAVYRYHMPDGLPGDEGGFLICGFWLVDALCRLGDVDNAEQRLAALVKLAGPTGLFAEEFDPESGLALGNVPQAYSHLGLLESSFLLNDCRR